MSNKNIGKLIGLDVRTLMLDDKHYLETKTSLAAPELIVGLELEIEGWNRRHHQDFIGFNFTEDNSLRNSGIEAVTLPTKSKFVPSLLTSFYEHYGITDINYSERCSTHVHVNVQDYTVDQLASLCLIYQVFERLLFNYIGHDRATNIFCVPWCQANVNVNLVEVVKTANWSLLQRWHKYTALNLCPVAGGRDGGRQPARGTVEYRHLYGTCDVEVITNWLNLIGSMHEFARFNNVDDIQKTIVELNTSSAYENFLHSVFGVYSNLLKVDHYQIAMEQGVIDAKLMLTKDVGLVEVPTAVPVEEEWHAAFNAEVNAARARLGIQPIIRTTIRTPNQLNNTFPEWAARVTELPDLANREEDEDRMEHLEQRIQNAQQGANMARAAVAPRAAPPVPPGPANRRGRF